MISLIAKTSSIIGFGLCGVKDLIEVNKNCGEQEILAAIKKAQHDVIMIDEDLHAKFSQQLAKTKKIFIDIPDRFKEKEQANNIDALVRDTIGVNIE